MSNDQTSVLKRSVISGVIGVVIGEVLTYLVSFVVPTTPEQLRWAMIAVGFSTFFGCFFSYRAGRAVAKQS